MTNLVASITLTELIQTYHALKASVTNKEDNKTLQILSTLSSTTVDKTLLQQCEIGIYVNKLRGLVKNDEVVAMSKTVVKKWKGDIEAQKGGKGKAGPKEKIREKAKEKQKALEKENGLKKMEINSEKPKISFARKMSQASSAGMH